MTMIDDGKFGPFHAGLGLPQATKDTHMSQPAEPELYVDATLLISTREWTLTFGPYSDRLEAERTLTALAGREGTTGAVIRNPEPRS